MPGWAHEASSTDASFFFFFFTEYEFTVKQQPKLMIVPTDTAGRLWFLSKTGLFFFFFYEPS